MGPFKKVKFKPKKMGKSMSKFGKTVSGFAKDLDPNKIVKSAIKSAGKPINKALTKGFSIIVKSLKNTFMKPIQNITSKFNVFSSVIKTIKNKIKSISPFLSGIFGKFINALRQIIEVFKTVFSSIFKVLIIAVKQFINSMKIFSKLFLSAFNTMIKFLKQIFDSILGFLRKLFNELTRIFNDFIFYIMCVWKKLIKFDKCIIYYCADILIQVILIPFQILFLIFPDLRVVGDVVEDMINMLDNIIYETVKISFGKGFHINQWPNNVLNDCYRCENENEKGDDSTSFLDYLSELFLNKSEGNFFIFTLRWFFTIVCVIIPVIYTYYTFKGDDCLSSGKC